jgi:hypothetical protein
VAATLISAGAAFFRRAHPQIAPAAAIDAGISHGSSDADFAVIGATDRGVVTRTTPALEVGFILHPRQ